MDKPLVDQVYRLERFPGKGGWTYVVIPEIGQDKNSPFGWRKVKGKIDDFEISRYHLMPMGGGKLFLPVKAEIRKKIKKQEGDEVRVVLYEDQSSLEIPQELKDCLQTEPGLYEKFLELKEGDKKAYIDWIFAAKRDETKVSRITKTIEKVLKGEPFYK